MLRFKEGMALYALRINFNIIYSEYVNLNIKIAYNFKQLRSH